MTKSCRHCGYEHTLHSRPPIVCRNCGCTDWQEYWVSEQSQDVIFRLKLAVRDILKINPFAGIGRTPDGHFVALIPYMCDRWLMNPELYGEFEGTVNNLEQIEPMLFGPTGVQATRTRVKSSAYSLGK